MNRRRTRVWPWLAMLVSGGTLFQTTGFTRTGLGGACQPRSFISNGALTSVDFCYLLDCENGFFGGAVQPCDPNNPANNLLLDCPTPVTVTPVDTTTTTQQQTVTNPFGNLFP